MSDDIIQNGGTLTSGVTTSSSTADIGAVTHTGTQDAAPIYTSDHYVPTPQMPESMPQPIADPYPAVQSAYVPPPPVDAPAYPTPYPVSPAVAPTPTPLPEPPLPGPNASLPAPDAQMKVGDACTNADGVAGTWQSDANGWTCVVEPVVAPYNPGPNNEAPQTPHVGTYVPSPGLELVAVPSPLPPVTGPDQAAVKAVSDLDMKAMLMAAEARGAQAARALLPELIAAAEDAAKAAAIAAVETALKDITLPDSFPPMVTSAWDNLKIWTRKEVALAIAGHSVETRSITNP